MASLIDSPQTIETLADLLERLGGIPLHRIRFHPYPGTATEADILEAERQTGSLFELVDGVLVEKAVGFRESLLAIALGEILRRFVVAHNLGLVSGADGTMRLCPGLVCVPDVAFIAWRSLPDGRVPDTAIPEVAPDLAIEILSKGNTPGEMARKRQDYFAAGVRLIWIIDPVARCVEIYLNPDDHIVRTERDSLDGGQVLPGFSVALSDLFAELDRTAHA